MPNYYPQNIIGLVYDFDGTLSPNNMQEDTIFRAYQINKEELWARSNQLVKSGYERTLAYLKLLIHDDLFKKKPLTRSSLRALASQIEYFPGVETYFDYINQFIAEIAEVKKWGITVEHYIISSGLVEILEGCSIFPHFKKVYACEYDYDEKGAVFPKLVINDTNKTQFLFRINKGRLGLDESINEHTPEKMRRIPFRNMIYIGDGDTDIPSMTVTRKFGGHTIAVFNPAMGVSPAVKGMVEEGRADHFAPANYEPKELLIKIIETALKKIIATIAYHGSVNKSKAWVRQHRALKNGSNK